MWLERNLMLVSGQRPIAKVNKSKSMKPKGDNMMISFPFFFLDRDKNTSKPKRKTMINKNSLLIALYIYTIIFLFYIVKFSWQKNNRMHSKKKTYQRSILNYLVVSCTDLGLWHIKVRYFYLFIYLYINSTVTMRKTKFES